MNSLDTILMEAIFRSALDTHLKRVKYTSESIHYCKGMKLFNIFEALNFGASKYTIIFYNLRAITTALIILLFLLLKPNNKKLCDCNESIGHERGN